MWPRRHSPEVSPGWKSLDELRSRTTTLAKPVERMAERVKRGRARERPLVGRLGCKPDGSYRQIPPFILARGTVQSGFVRPLRRSQACF